MEDIEKLIKRERNRIHLSRSIHLNDRSDVNNPLTICFGIYYLDIAAARKASRGGYGGENYRTWRMKDRIYALGKNINANQWAVFNDSDYGRTLFYFDEHKENGMDATKLSLEALGGIFREILSGTQKQVEDRMHREMLDNAIGYLLRPSAVIGIQNPILVDEWKNVIITANQAGKGEKD